MWSLSRVHRAAHGATCRRWRVIHAALHRDGTARPHVRCRDSAHPRCGKGGHGGPRRGARPAVRRCPRSHILIGVCTTAWVGRRRRYHICVRRASTSACPGLGTSRACVQQPCCISNRRGCSSGPEPVEKVLIGRRGRDYKTGPFDGRSGGRKRTAHGHIGTRGATHDTNEGLDTAIDGD